MPPHRRSRRLATLVARPTYQPPRHQPISLAALALVVLASPLPPLYRRFVAVSGTTGGVCDSYSS